MFEWTDGSAVQFTNWNTNQPDNWRNYEHCVHTIHWAEGRWNDIGCAYNMGYICKKKKGLCSAVLIVLGCFHRF